ncbi:hypothetical protein DFH11DRAFT_1801831 [Phellopilus nigrolimitatus]|nr:hypothetical protein DFH11DRAFT_1801831 [Phellopilus nigrolimitatus]
MTIFKKLRINNKTRIFLFLCATVMSVLPTISIKVPAFSTLDIARTKTNPSEAGNVKEIRFGVWSYCLHRSSVNGDVCETFSPCEPSESLRVCSNQKYGYELVVTASGKLGTKKLDTNWTRALAVHAAALITFVVDVIFQIYIRTFTKELKHIGVGQSTTTTLRVGPGFILQLISNMFLVLEFCFILDDGDGEVDPWDRRSSSESSESPRPDSPAQSATRPESPRPESPRPGSPTQSAPIPQTESPMPISPSESIPTTRNTSQNPKKFELYTPKFTLMSPLKRALKPHRKATDLLPGKECPICTDRKMNAELRELPCEHVFCLNCIKTSVELYKRCPLCNRNAEDIELRNVSSDSFV